MKAWKPKEVVIRVEIADKQGRKGQKRRQGRGEGGCGGGGERDTEDEPSTANVKGSLKGNGDTIGTEEISHEIIGPLTDPIVPGGEQE